MEEIEAEIDFCSLGMFIIDEIHFPPPKQPVKNILGGAGSYSALGARLFSPPPLSKSVGWIVDCGSDFPPEIRRVLARWNTGCLIRETPNRLTTRGWNGYERNDFRAFRYLTPKLRLDANDLTAPLLASKSFHLICTPSRCISLVQDIHHLRTASSSATSSSPLPLIIWEPVPDFCVPAQLPACLDALKLVDIVSPNHAELAGFFGQRGEVEDMVEHEVIERCAAEWVAAGIGQDGGGGVVVRAGNEGCYVVRGEQQQQQQQQQQKLGRWLPAYHQPGSQKVVDPTGGGNAFLGGMAVALARGKDLEEAAMYGSIAASFAIEQVGMPQLEERINPSSSIVNDEQQQKQQERWNGESVQGRLERFAQIL